MKRVQDISLLEVFTKYAKIDNFTADSGNRYKCVCPFHKDTNPSLTIYDKTSLGYGWDYHCFACGAHGNAVTALVNLKLAQTEGEAESILRRDFQLVYPTNVTLPDLCSIKGIDPKFAANNGWGDKAGSGVRIPYLDTNGNELNVKVRTKYEGKSDKFYFEKTGFDTVPYGLHWLDAYEDTIIYITEGETDTMTMRQAGYPTIGIGGARAFNDEFSSYISRFKSIVVVKDNDEAGWNLVAAIGKQFAENLYMVVLPNGVKDVNNFHVNRCSGDISSFKANFEQLTILPATPLTFIQAVKAGTVTPTSNECWDMVLHACPTKADVLYFKEEFCKQTKFSKSLVNDCIKSAKKPSEEVERDDGEFIIIDGCYYKEVYRGDAVVQVRITNFVVNPQFDMVADNEVVRVVNLINNEGYTAEKVYFDAETLASTTKFNQRCLGAGNYIFTGDQTDLFCMCYTIFNVPKDTVYAPKMIGRLNAQHWLFGNCGIDSTGAVVPISDGIVKLDGTAYKPRGISIQDAEGDTGNSMDIPCIDYNTTNKLGIDYQRRLMRAFHTTFGTYGAWLSLGWVVAGWYSREIFQNYSIYPYLYVTGKRASGKSVFCTLLQSSFGFNPNQAGMSIESPTNVGIMRYLAYRSSLPQWYDDYRNGVRRIQMKDNLLLDAYNRHGSVKGTKDGGVNTEAVNGFLLLSGEDLPSNNALLTRCCVVTLSANERDASVFEDARELFSSFPAFCIRYASEAVGGLPEALKAEIDSIHDHILKVTGDAREAANKAIFAGAFLYSFGKALTDDERTAFMDYLCTSSLEQVHTVNEEHPMQVFFDEFCDLSLKQGEDYILDTKNNLVYLRMNSCHYSWTQHHDKVAPLSKAVLTKYISKEPYYLGDDRKYFDCSGRQRCMKLDLAKMTDSEYLIGFTDYISKQGDGIPY